MHVLVCHSVQAAQHPAATAVDRPEQHRACVCACMPACDYDQAWGQGGAHACLTMHVMYATIAR